MPFCQNNAPSYVTTPRQLGDGVKMVARGIVTVAVMAGGRELQWHTRLFDVQIIAVEMHWKQQP